MIQAEFKEIAKVDALLCGFTFLLMIIVVLWLRLMKHEPLHLPSALHLLLCIITSTILTQYALTDERNFPINKPINVIPPLSLLYLGIQYNLATKLVLKAGRIPIGNKS